MSSGASTGGYSTSSWPADAGAPGRGMETELTGTPSRRARRTTRACALRVIEPSWRGRRRARQTTMRKGNDCRHKRETEHAVHLSKKKSATVMGKTVRRGSAPRNLAAANSAAQRINPDNCQAISLPLGVKADRLKPVTLSKVITSTSRFCAIESKTAFTSKPSNKLP